MTDVEASSRPTPGAVNNPYSNSQPPPILHHWHPVNVLRRCIYMGGSLYGLNYFSAYDTLMNSPDVSHEWFKIGLASTVGLLFVKAYVEVYSGQLKKEKVNYDNFRQSTHSAMFLILLSSLAYNKALWPVYHGKSMFIMTLVGCFVLNFCLLFPTYIQNLTAFAVLTFFLQEYK